MELTGKVRLLGALWVAAAVMGPLVALGARGFHLRYLIPKLVISPSFYFLVACLVTSVYVIIQIVSLFTSGSISIELKGLREDYKKLESENIELQSKNGSLEKENRRLALDGRNLQSQVDNLRCKVENLGENPVDDEIQFLSETHTKLAPPKERPVSKKKQRDVELKPNRADSVVHSVIEEGKSPSINLNDVVVDSGKTEVKIDIP